MKISAADLMAFSRKFENLLKKLVEKAITIENKAFEFEIVKVQHSEKEKLIRVKEMELVDF